MADRTAAETAFRIWINSARGRRLHRKGAVIKNSPKVMKTVEFSYYGSPDDGEVRKRELRFALMIPPHIERSNSVMTQVARTLLYPSRAIPKIVIILRVN